MKRVALEHPTAFVKFSKGMEKLLDITKEEYVFPAPAVWRRWQRRVLDICEGPIHDRKITWVYDWKGSAGKSLLCKWLVSNKEALFLSGAKLADAACAYNGQPIVVFDIPRSTPADFVNYGTIETIKNGMVFQGLKFPSSS